MLKTTGLFEMLVVKIIGVGNNKAFNSSSSELIKNLFKFRLWNCLNIGNILFKLW